jgi:hypothetical protein
MLPKFFASWLVVLVLMPFTAPFSTCDPTGLFGSGQDQSDPLAPPTDAAVTHDNAVPRVPCISTAGRIRLSLLSGLPVTQTKISSSTTRFLWSGLSAVYIREHTLLSTILRL